MNELKRLFHSFSYALRGIAFCIRHEKNMRIHIVATLYVLFFAQFYPLRAWEFAIILLTCVIVLSLEMLNTAIEVIIDKVSPEYSALAKVGKDVAAGAVFVSAVMAIMIGLVMFWDTEIFYDIWIFFSCDLYNAAMLLASATMAFVFINTGKKRKIKGKRNLIDE